MGKTNSKALDCLQVRGLSNAAYWAPGTPLWQRVPTRDEAGAKLSDFMMIIPGLKQQSRSNIEDTIQRIEKVLKHYQQHVIFADLNLKLSVLWVSIKPIPGLCLELASVLHDQVPAAKLVAAKLD